MTVSCQSTAHIFSKTIICEKPETNGISPTCAGHFISGHHIRPGGPSSYNNQIKFGLLGSDYSLQQSLPIILVTVQMQRRREYKMATDKKQAPEGLWQSYCNWGDADSENKIGVRDICRDIVVQGNRSAALPGEVDDYFIVLLRDD